MTADRAEVNAEPFGRETPSALIAVVAARARVEHMMHAVADVAAGGGDGVAALAPEVGGLMARGAPGLHHGVADPAPRILGGVDRIGEDGARQGEGGEG
jgi:hypothetical protein